MSEWKKFYKAFQESNPEKFNERIIHLKEEDDILEKIEDACYSLESVDGIKFDGAKILSDRVIYQDKELNNNEKYEVNYEESRLIKIEINFTLSKKNENKENEETKIKKILQFPRLLDGCYYYINSVKYYPIFQIVDAETYKTGNSIIMRTSLQPIILSKKKITVKIENHEEEEINGYFVYSEIFKVKVPIFNYFFAQMGVTKTLKFFSINNWEILDKNDIKNFNKYEDYYLFKLGKLLYLKVPISYIKDNENSNQNTAILLSFLNAFKNNDKLPIEKIDNIGYWNRKLGGYFTKNVSNFDNKGLSVKSSFERLLDNTTKRLIRIPKEDKENIYTLLRWFLINYNNLLSQNNDDLANKRLRLNECFIFPLLDNWTQGVLRILNGKNITIKKLKTLFSNINEDFLVKKCISSKTDNLRYMNNVNSIDLGNKLKITIAGNQSISNSKGEIRGKTIDVSMLGKVCLVHTSNNDPGTTRMLTPFCEVNDTWHFTDEPNIKTESFDGDYIEDVFDIEEEFEEYLNIESRDIIDDFEEDLD